MIERQIHLDFHTSPDIPQVAAAFDAAAFGDYYRDLAATSVTVFARDHHGYLFFRSQAEPGAMHPTSVVPDLLEQQIAALHERGIRAPIYTTVQWDHRTALAHPEWLCRDADGRVINTQDVPAPNFYDSLCLNTPYRDYLLAHIADIIQSVGPANVDGLFFDIVNVVPCACPSCQETMAAAGLDWHDPAACRQNCAAVLAAFKDEVAALIRRQLSHATIFFNASHVGPGQEATLADYTQLEIESLPNGAWGYDNFSRVARYTRTLGLPYLGMTGKFHTYWGDFHSLKRPAALEFECFQMVSLGAGCSIGDQLLPSGALLAGTKALIAPVYRRLKALSERLPQTTAVAPIAILTAEGALTSPAGAASALTGAVRLLEQAHQQFDIVDATSDWTPYRLLVVLDVLPAESTGLAAKIKAFIAAGGKVLGCDHAAELGAFGVDYAGRSPWQRDFIQPNAVLGRQLVAEPFVMYETGAAVAAAGAEPVLETRVPYFNREGTTFTSHQHAPSSGVAGVPAAWRTGAVRHPPALHAVLRLRPGLGGKPLPRRAGAAGAGTGGRHRLARHRPSRGATRRQRRPVPARVELLDSKNRPPDLLGGPEPGAWGGHHRAAGRLLASRHRPGRRSPGRHRGGSGQLGWIGRSERRRAGWAGRRGV
ncbi:hypothetical protein [Lacticaseibacillus parakribbianus]|uniref:hypothetical protein n=1 Tax=Lacticaseibacillus parakribbianus TaxID=2970927 RepID=UPI0021CB51F3|nr:hypothetical protein [Lacticaseibacillus parakribbianus]